MEATRQEIITAVPIPKDLAVNLVLHVSRLKISRRASLPFQVLGLLGLLISSDVLLSLQIRLS